MCVPRASLCAALFDRSVRSLELGYVIVLAVVRG